MQSEFCCQRSSCVVLSRYRGDIRVTSKQMESILIQKKTVCQCSKHRDTYIFSKKIGLVICLLKIDFSFWIFCDYKLTLTKRARNGPIHLHALLLLKDMHKFIFSFDTKTNLGCNQILSNWWPAFPYASQEPKLRTPCSKYYEKPYKKN